MDEPSNVSDDDDDTFDDTFVLVDDNDDDDTEGATEVMSLVEVLGSSPPPPPRRRMITAGTTPRSSPFGSIPIGSIDPLGHPPPLRSPSWASQGSRTPSLARKSSMMSFRSLRRKVSNMSIGGGNKDQGSLE